MENKYLKHSHISEAKFRQLVRLFCEDMTALQIARLTDLNRKTVNRVLHNIRRAIVRYCEANSPLSGEVEIDESYFGSRRVGGVRGRGAGRKTIVFGLLKREGKVYTQIVPNVSRETLEQIVQAKVAPDSTIYSDGWRSYDGLVDWGYKRHYRVNHGANEFARGP
jgi:transposase-like protein